MQSRIIPTLALRHRIEIPVDLSKADNFVVTITRPKTISHTPLTTSSVPMGASTQVVPTNTPTKRTNRITEVIDFDLTGLNYVTRMLGETRIQVLTFPNYLSENILDTVISFKLSITLSKLDNKMIIEPYEEMLEYTYGQDLIFTIQEKTGGNP